MVFAANFARARPIMELNRIFSGTQAGRLGCKSLRF